MTIQFVYILFPFVLERGIKTPSRFTIKEERECFFVFVSLLYVVLRDGVSFCTFSLWLEIVMTLVRIRSSAVFRCQANEAYRATYAFCDYVAFPSSGTNVASVLASW